ncbi:hypothetical protein C0995_002021 [Termitomyces sp. Mi166|nr:hypothetical protein C0995_002021 [Termitomyces sp. Mi166\
MPGFPQELIDVVLDFLADEKQTLRSCSVVASSFRLTSQKHLFHSIDIYLDRAHYVANSRLHFILSWSPRLREYVRALALDLYGGSGHSNIADVLDMLSQLRSLRLLHSSGTSRWPSPPSVWQSLPGSFKNALLKLLTSPRLVELSLEYVDIPFIYLASFSQLKHLSLPLVVSVPRTQASMSEAGVMIPRASTSALLPSTPGHLVSLKVFNSWECQMLVKLLHRPDSALLLTRLSRYHGRILLDEDLGPSQDILSIAANSLSSVVLRMECRDSIAT